MQIYIKREYKKNINTYIAIKTMISFLAVASSNPVASLRTQVRIFNISHLYQILTTPVLFLPLCPSPYFTFI